MNQKKAKKLRSQARALTVGQKGKDYIVQAKGRLYGVTDKYGVPIKDKDGAQETQRRADSLRLHPYCTRAMYKLLKAAN